MVFMWDRVHARSILSEAMSQWPKHPLILNYRPFSVEAKLSYQKIRFRSHASCGGGWLMNFKAPRARNMLQAILAGSFGCFSNPCDSVLLVGASNDAPACAPSFSTAASKLYMLDALHISITAQLAISNKKLAYGSETSMVYTGWYIFPHLLQLISSYSRSTSARPTTSQLLRALEVSSYENHNHYDFSCRWCRMKYSLECAGRPRTDLFQALKVSSTEWIIL